MKQLKKISTLLLLLVTMAMVATSCKKDDNESNLEGTWSHYSSEDDEGTYYEEEELLMVLKSGGKGEFKYDGETEPFRWHADNKYLYIRYYDAEEGEFDDEDEYVEYKLTNKDKTLIIYSGAIEVWNKI